MFDIGFTELLVIAVVALVVLGPERLPKAARFAGLWVRRARAQWHSVKDELERELAADELKRNLHEARQTLHETEQSIRDGGDAVKQEFEQVREGFDDALSGQEDPRDSDAAPAPAADPPADAETPPTGADEPQAPAENEPQADLFGNPEQRR